MIYATPQPDELGFSLNPIRAVKSVAKKTYGVTKTVVKAPVKYAVKPVAKGAYKVAKTTGKVAVKGLKITGNAALTVGNAIKTGVLTPLQWIGSQLTKPLRSRVRTLKSRRATKLAWDKRKSKTPTAAENAEAASWAKGRLKSSGPHGHVLALFAGADEDGMLGSAVAAGGLGIDPGTASVIAASIPILMAVLNAILSKANASGEAPADPSADAAAAAQEAADSGVPPDAAEAMDQAADAAAAAVEAGGIDPTTGEPIGPGRGGGSMLPAGVKKNHLLIGGGILLAVFLVATVMKKKDCRSVRRSARGVWRAGRRRVRRRR